MTLHLATELDAAAAELNTLEGVRATVSLGPVMAHCDVCHDVMCRANTRVQWTVKPRHELARWVNRDAHDLPALLSAFVLPVALGEVRIWVGAS